MNEEFVASPEVVRDLERVEVNAWRDWYQCADAELVRRFGIAVLQRGGAIASVATGVDTLAYNRLFGLGLSEPANEELLDELIDFYRQAGRKKVFVQVSPYAEPSELVNWLTARGARHYNNWVKLYRGVEPPAEVSTDLTVREIVEAEAQRFGEIVVSSFEWDERLARWIALTVGRPHWKHYMAFDGETAVATGAIYLSEGYGWIDLAATLSEYRGRGGQGALVRQRLLDGIAAGVKGFVVETAQQTPEKQAPSYRNMLRYGFIEAYARPNLLLELD